MSRGKLIFAHVLIALQVLLALGYYTWRTDDFDERFAWRMFSTERLTRCQVEFQVGEPRRKVALHNEFHQAWINIARRGRREVIESMASHLCRKNAGEAVRVLATCRTLAKTRHLSSGTFDLCKTGAL